MAITLPSTDPADDYYRPISNGRVILVSNSSVSWSYGLTERYRKKKRIPAANHLQFALGTNFQFVPASDAALNSGVLTPIADLMDSIGAQAVLLGPGVPDQVVLNGVWQSPSVPPDSNNSTISMSTVLASARQIRDGIAAGQGLGCSGGGQFPILYDTSGAPYAVTYIGGSSSDYADVRMGYQASGLPTPSATYYDSYTGVDDQYGYPTYHYLPTQAGLDGLGNANSLTVMTGKIGTGYSPTYNYIQTEPIPTEWKESQAYAAQIMERALRYEEGNSPDRRYQNPVHFQFQNGYSGYYRSLGYLCQQMQGWGYNTSYAWRTSADSGMSAYVPYSGTAYTIDQLQAGLVKDRPYHLMVGDASNYEMPNQPFIDAWKPTAGGGSCLGPSEGWQYALNGLHRGAASGMSNIHHITAAIYTALYSFTRNLLRGMSWSEAHYYADGHMFQYCLPVGDPLARPFPQ